MPYPPPAPDDLNEWAALVDVDEIVAQALHAINDPLEHPPEDVLQVPTLEELNAIKQCCTQWMAEGHYPWADAVNFNGVRLRVER